MKNLCLSAGSVRKPNLPGLGSRRLFCPNPKLIPMVNPLWSVMVNFKKIGFVVKMAFSVIFCLSKRVACRFLNRLSV